MLLHCTCLSDVCPVSGEILKGRAMMSSLFPVTENSDGGQEGKSSYGIERGKSISRWLRQEENIDDHYKCWTFTVQSIASKSFDDLGFLHFSTALSANNHFLS